jgi:hypothetical protein
VNDSDVKITDSALKNFIHNDGVTALSSSSLTGRIDQNGGELNVSDVTVAGNFDTGNDAAKTVAFRTTVTGNCNWRSKLSWFGYGKARRFNFNGADAKVVFVGSEIDGEGGLEVGMNLEGSNNQFVVSNSYIHNIAQGQDGNRGNIFDNNLSNAIEISGAGHSVTIQNNYLSTSWANYGSINYIVAVFGSQNATIRNNVFASDTTRAVQQVFAEFGVAIKNNLWGFSDGVFSVGGGASSSGNLTADYDLLFVDDNPYKLAEGSPLIDAGTEDPRYNDRDGTRNNIGPSGGSWYDPEGWTTEKPVVISFDLLPDSVLEGVDTKVTIEGVRAVSKP